MEKRLQIRTVVRIKTSHYVALGSEALERLGLKERDQVIVTVDPPFVKIRKLGALEIAQLYEGAPITKEAKP